MAEEVLRDARLPLTPREILKRAYSSGKAPSRLYGKTQHKTLQARLSEDILELRERSCFFRTAPGRFFLREYLDDPTIPLKFRTPITARRRKRQLPYRNALAFKSCQIKSIQIDTETVSKNCVMNLLENSRFHYAKSSVHRQEDEVIMWSFVVVMREFKVLTYRHGHYREDRDGFLNRRSVGFFTPVVDSDRTLFDFDNHGIISSGVRALAIDLDITQSDFFGNAMNAAHIVDFIIARNDKLRADLLALIRFDAPEWFEPWCRRLAINDLRWQDLRLPWNQIEDFDSWSQIVIQHARRNIL
jgi:hypothetical protein